MNTHPFLRAFLAGTFVPTLILPLLLVAFIVIRLVMKVQVPIERGLIFPMAVVPALWGLWNMLYLGWHERTHLAVGPHGAILPLLLAPLGAIVATSLGILHLGATGFTWFQACQVPYGFLAFGLCIGVAVYYLVWKYIVGYLNHVLGIAA